MFQPGPWEIIIIVAIALLIFGPKRLPEIGKAIGSAVTEFKKGISGKDESSKSDEAAAAPKKIEESKAEEEKSTEPAG